MKKYKIIIFILFICLSGYGIKNYQNKKQDIEHNTIILLGEYLLDGVRDHRYKHEQYYVINDETQHNNIFIKSPELKKRTDELPRMIIFFLDDDTVLMSEGAIFQSIKGYLVTDDDYTLPSVLHVSSLLGCDGNRIDTEKIKDCLYRWSGGL